VNFLKRTGETVLDKIVGGDDVARQNPRPAPQRWDQGYDFFVQISIDQCRLRRMGPYVCGTATLIVGPIRFQSVHGDGLGHPLCSVVPKLGGEFSVSDVETPLLI